MVVALCRFHHRYITDHPKKAEELKRHGQEIFEKEYGHEKYMEVFKRNYL